MRMDFSQQGRVVADACKEMGLPLAELRTLPVEYHYSSLPLAVADAIYSIGVGYDAQVKPAMARFAGHLGISLTGEPSVGCHGCLTLLGGLPAHETASDVFANRGRTSTRNGILKADAVMRAMRLFHECGIDTINDLRAAGVKLRVVEEAFREIPGQRTGISWKYLLMLTGDEDLIKPDRMIKRFLAEALGLGAVLSEDGCVDIVRAAAAELSREFPFMTPRRLDYAIWSWQRAQGRELPPNEVAAQA